MITLSVLSFLFISIVLFYNRATIVIWTISLIAYFALLYHFFGPTWGVIVCISLFALLFIPLNVAFIRRRLITKQLWLFYCRVMPEISRTEKEVISAGTVSWEKEILNGKPNWRRLLEYPTAKLTREEQHFLDGPADELCRMVSDWEITHEYTDFTPETWHFIKEKGFFSLIIPKEYGGKAFSAYAHSQILTKLSGRSITLSSTIAVPNSLGPAELILKYGTEEQKNYYLPRLASGEEIPCFALTSTKAGSDASAMTDYGVICWGEFNNEKVVGIRINCEKRYITLAPIATVIGLAFKLYDPDHLIGNREDIGITCALVPRQTPGLTIGRRHFPMNTPFMNGPIIGKDIFIPFEMIIGGKEMVGKGWGMLMACLATGRAISLPASALGGAKVLSHAAGAYARIRRQFNMPIGKFEGIEEPLARIGAFTYAMDAARTFAAAAIDAGEKPAIASAIVKYHVTEMGRQLAGDGMDIHGGKGICLGPKNYLGRGYQATPIAITVEGANILTRSMIIFGQGLMRCHPYLLAELEAANLSDRKTSLKLFDKIVFKHIGFACSNLVRSLVLALTGSLIVNTPLNGKPKRYLQHATRFASALACLSDVALLVLGGNLKRKEAISARLGDILSYLYLMSAIIKRNHDLGTPKEDQPIISYLCYYYLYETQERFKEVLQNFPNKPLAFVMNFIIFPFGGWFTKPGDKLKHRIAQLLMSPTATRSRLTEGAFLTECPENILSQIQDALIKTIASEPIEKTIRHAKKEGKIKAYTFVEQAQEALAQQLISLEQFDILMQAEEAKLKILAVDDFTTEELAHARQSNIRDIYANTAT